MKYILTESYLIIWLIKKLRIIHTCLRTGLFAQIKFECLSKIYKGLNKNIKFGKIRLDKKLGPFKLGIYPKTIHDLWFNVQLYT